MTLLWGVVVGLAVVAVAAPGPVVRRSAPVARPPRVDPVTALGRFVERRLPVAVELSPMALGWVSVTTFVLLPVAPVPALLVPSVVLIRASRRRRAHARRRAAAIRRGLPEVVDLLLLAVSAGLTGRDALAQTIDWLPDPFGEPVREVLRRSDAGEAFADALAGLGDALGEPGRPLVAVIVAAERDGAALGPALERASDEARRRRRLDAEEAARRVPVAMLFPLVICVLPAFALLTVVPILVGTLSDLQLPSAGP